MSSLKRRFEKNKHIQYQFPFEIIFNCTYETYVFPAITNNKADANQNGNIQLVCVCLCVEKSV